MTTNHANGDRRTQILEAACRVIARRGADGLRMGAVAREAGVSSALIHYYFATRSDLLVHAFEHAEDKTDRAALEAIQRIERPLPRLERLLLLYAGADPLFREDWILWVEMWRSAIYDEALRGSVQRSTEYWNEPDRRGDLRRPGGGGDLRRHRRRRTPRCGWRQWSTASGSSIIIESIDHERAQDLIRGALRLELGLGQPTRSTSMSAVAQSTSQTLPGPGVRVARGLRARDARGVHALVDLRLPRQRRGRAGLLLDDVDRRRAGGGRCAIPTASCARCPTSAATARRGS